MNKAEFIEQQFDLDREVAEERNREYYDDDYLVLDDYFSDYKEELTREFLEAYDSEFQKFIKDSYAEHIDELRGKC